MFDSIKSFSSRILIIITTIITGPNFNTSDYELIKSNSKPKPSLSYAFVITIALGLMDSVLYFTSLHSSIQLINKFHNQTIPSNKEASHYSNHSQFKLLESVSQTLETLIINQKNLDELTNELIHNLNVEPMLLENVINKFQVLQYVQRDSITQINGHVNESIQLLKLNSIANKTDSVLLNSYLFDRIYLFIFSISFLIYIYQILLWIFKYLSLKDLKTYSSYSLIVSIFTIAKVICLIYFIEMMNMFHYMFPLYIFMCLTFIRSSIIIYQNSFSI